MYTHYTLREVYKITEMRDGAIYRTESLGIYWIKFHMDRRDNNPDTSEEAKILLEEVGGDGFNSVGVDIAKRIIYPNAFVNENRLYFKFADDGRNDYVGKVSHTPAG